MLIFILSPIQKNHLARPRITNDTIKDSQMEQRQIVQQGLLLTSKLKLQWMHV